MYNCVSLQVQASLKNLAERRTDIFGVEETLIGQKVMYNSDSVCSMYIYVAKNQGTSCGSVISTNLLHVHIIYT